MLGTGQVHTEGTDTQAVFTLSDARSFLTSAFGLSSTIPPLGSMLNFDADVKK